MPERRRSKPVPKERHSLRSIRADSAPIGRIRTHDQLHLCPKRTRSQLPDMAQTPREPPPARRLPAFVPGNWQSTSAHVEDPVIHIAIGNIVLHKTCRRWLFRLPLTPAQTEALALPLLLAPESSCATLDASVWRGAFCSGQRATGHQRSDPRSCSDIRLPKIVLLR